MINENNIVSVTKQYDDNSVFYTYRVLYNTDKICFVPLDPANTDYQAIQEWAAIDGNNIIDPGA